MVMLVLVLVLVLVCVVGRAIDAIGGGWLSLGRALSSLTTVSAIQQVNSRKLTVLRSHRNDVVYQ